MWLPPGESSAIMWPITSAFQLWKNYYSVLKLLPVECSTTCSTLPLVWRFPFVWAGDTGECGFWWSEVTAKFEHIPSCPESRSSNHLDHLQPKQSIWGKSMDENILTEDRLLNTNLCWIPNGKKSEASPPKKLRQQTTLSFDIKRIINRPSRHRSPSRVDYWLQLTLVVGCEFAQITLHPYSPSHDQAATPSPAPMCCLCAGRIPPTHHRAAPPCCVWLLPCPWTWAGWRPRLGWRGASSPAGRTWHPACYQLRSLASHRWHMALRATSDSEMNKGTRKVHFFLREAE